MNWLVIITASVTGSTVQAKWTRAFEPGTTRSRVYAWAYREADLDRYPRGHVAVMFFYAEPDEVAL